MEAAAKRRTASRFGEASVQNMRTQNSHQVTVSLHQSFPHSACATCGLLVDNNVVILLSPK